MVLECNIGQREGAEFTETDKKELDGMDWGARVAESASTDGIQILDALAATGLRSIRYAKEIPGVKKVVVNDLDEAAVQTAQRNIDFNQVDPSMIRVQRGDAISAMHSSIAAKDRFDVIDLDPYGSAAPFLDAAVQSVEDGGLLCVTCTDMGVLSGGNPETCYAKYGSMPTKGKYLHEMALRIVMHALEAQANRYRRHIVPVLSLSIDFYVRLFVRVFISPAEVKKACTKAAYVHQSLACGSFFLQPIGKFSRNYNPSLMTGDGLCPQTGKRLKVGGPIWSPPIHDLEWVRLLLERVEEYRGPYQPATKKRIHGMLTSVSEELPDVPLFYTLPDLCLTLHCVSPPMVNLQAALVNAGYRVSQQHKEPQAVKTDAPDQVVWDIMRCWVKKHPVNDKRKTPTSPGQIILARESKLEADFSVPSGLLQKKAATRYQMNPEPYWGPKSRATGIKRGQTSSDDGAGNGDSFGKKAKTVAEPSEDVSISEAEAEKALHES